ncbi:DUF3581 domain-containing protein [Porticoccaceae bacterium]|jgi:hypothetical protein|nr:DUF3581 domain-containing protein [Porticoccaceae bacterium]MDA9014651.1 DUF3581 domain-containing protein [Porticoccaceae bacterium]
MFLQSFFSQNGNQLSISAEQGSQFAKQVCNDYNPIHDVESKRFCVPGDLLFALTLNNYGLSQQMRFDFSGLVPANKELLFPEWNTSELSITDSREKIYLNAYREGDMSQEQSAIEYLVRSYVEFSGHSFPYILVPLMQQHQVMINVARPLVMYQSMSLSLDQIALSTPEVKFLDAQMEVDGKRGNVTLQFSINEGEKAIGRGEKKLVLSGLREFDQQAMDQLILDYEARKA